MWQEVFDNVYLELPNVKADALTVALAMTTLFLIVMGLGFIRNMLSHGSEGNVSSDDIWLRADRDMKKADRAEAARKRVLWRNKNDDDND